MSDGEREIASGFQTFYTVTSQIMFVSKTIKAFIDLSGFHQDKGFNIRSHMMLSLVCHVHHANSHIRHRAHQIQQVVFHSSRSGCASSCFRLE